MSTGLTVLVIVLGFIIILYFIAEVFDAIKSHDELNTQKYIECYKSLGTETQHYDGTPITLEPQSEAHKTIKIEPSETCSSCEGFKSSDFEEPCKGCSHLGGSINKYKKAEGKEA